VSKMKVVDLIYFPFLFYFHFPFDLFSIFLFLELRVRVKMTRSHSYIRWYSHKSQDVKNERSGLNIFLFSFFMFIFFSIYFPLFLLLELGLGLEWQDHAVTQQVTSDDTVTITWHIEGYRRFWKDDVIQHVKYMLILRRKHGYLG